MKTRILIAAVAVLAIAAPATAHAAPGQVKTSCFSAQSWGGGTAPDSARPCTTVVAPNNDVVRVIQGTTVRAESVCVISYANINDARCHRVNRARVVHAPPSLQTVCTTIHLCAAITVPEEDGSGSVTVYNHLHRIERCTLSNPTEEAARYRVPCSA